MVVHSVPTKKSSVSSYSEPSCTGASGEPLSTAPFEKPGDCDNFYQCGAGILYTMPCAPGTSFSPALGICDHSYNVPGCGGGDSNNGGGSSKNMCQDASGRPLSTPPFEKVGD